MMTSYLTAIGRGYQFNREYQMRIAAIRGTEMQMMLEAAT